MKLTKSKLKEIIRETIEEEMNIPIWERHLPEGWFQDLKAKAQKAYVKANPGSKYAKSAKAKDDEKKKPDELSIRKDIPDKLSGLIKGLPSKERTQKIKAAAVKSVKNIDWGGEPDADDLSNAADTVSAANPKYKKALDSYVDAYQGAQQSGDMEEIEKLKGDIKKLMIKGLKK